MVKITSFGYKHGRFAADRTLVIDCRELVNPHNNKNLRPFTGKDACVRAFVGRDPNASELLLEAFNLAKQGVNVAFGCIGGRHRSVAMAIMLSQGLAQEGVEFQIEHRELT